MDGPKPRSGPGLPSVGPASARRHPGRHLPRQPTLTFEGALTKQFGVTRPKVRQDLSEVRASGPVEAIKGRGTFAHSPHTVTPAPRPRHVRRPSDGNHVKADGVRWTDAEPTVATRSRRSTGPSGPTSHPVGRADAHIQRLIDRRPLPSSSTPPDIRPVLGAQRHQLQGGGPPPELYTALANLDHDLTSRSTSAPACLCPTRLRPYDSPTGSRCSTSLA